MTYEYELYQTEHPLSPLIRPPCDDRRWRWRIKDRGRAVAEGVREYKARDGAIRGLALFVGRMYWEAPTEQDVRHRLAKEN